MCSVRHHLCCNIITCLHISTMKKICEFNTHHIFLITRLNYNKNNISKNAICMIIWDSCVSHGCWTPGHQPEWHQERRWTPGYQPEWHRERQRRNRLKRFDKYCHFGNEVDMNKASLRHLQQQVRSYKPEIPYYVCRISKTTTQLSRGKMIFDKQHTEKHLKRLTNVRITIPTTCITSSSWYGTQVRLNTVANGHAIMTSGWPDVVTGTELSNGDICMICFYNGGKHVGCFVARLDRWMCIS